MFDWLGDLFSGIGNVIGDTIDFLGEQLANTIFDALLQWFYETIYNAVADFFTLMGNMGAEIFDLSWVQATIRLFTLFGWSLFVAGTVVAIFDVAIEYQNGRANIKTTAINILKGFFACSLIGVVPVELYRFCSCCRAAWPALITAEASAFSGRNVEEKCLRSSSSALFPEERTCSGSPFSGRNVESNSDKRVLTVSSAMESAGLLSAFKGSFVPSNSC